MDMQSLHLLRKFYHHSSPTACGDGWAIHWAATINCTKMLMAMGNGRSDPYAHAWWAMYIILELHSRHHLLAQKIEDRRFSTTTINPFLIASFTTRPTKSYNLLAKETRIRFSVERFGKPCGETCDLNQFFASCQATSSAWWCNEYSLDQRRVQPL